MTASSSSSACNTTAKAGNACRACSVMGSLYTCSGGTTCPKLKSVTCSAGTYLPAGKTSCSTCTAGYKCPGGTFTASATVTQGRTQCAAGTYSGAGASSCTVCGTNKWSNAGASSCSSCDTTDGYGNSGTTAASHAGSASCKVTCAAGTYVKTANAACTSVGTGYYRAAHTVSYGSTSTRSQCPANYRDGAATTSEAGCAKNCISQSIVGGVNTPVSDSVNYPASCTYTTVCDDGYNLTGANTCSQLCTLGVTSLRTGNGVTIPLYSSALSTPSLNIGTGGGVCYGILESGAGTLNIQYDGKTYHAVD